MLRTATQENRLMTISKADLERFYKFAAEQLGNGGANSTLEELVSRWHASREYIETAEGIQQGCDDYAAGEAQPLTEAFNQVRRDLRLTI